MKFSSSSNKLKSEVKKRTHFIPVIIFSWVDFSVFIFLHDLTMGKILSKFRVSFPNRKQFPGHWFKLFLEPWNFRLTIKNQQQKYSKNSHRWRIKLEIWNSYLKKSKNKKKLVIKRVCNLYIYIKFAERKDNFSKARNDWWKYKKVGSIHSEHTTKAEEIRWESADHINRNLCRCLRSLLFRLLPTIMGKKDIVLDSVTTVSFYVS